MIKVLFVFGTRPEAIKMAPLILKLKKNPELFNTTVCVTGQHKEMLYQVLDFFEIQPDVDLAGMKQNQTLFDVTTSVLNGLEKVLNNIQPDYVIVQGDTTSAFTGALAAFYAKSKVIHLEAGLRSYNLYSPWPEEANRQLVSKIANIHFTPTHKATKALANEGITENVFEVGNTVIDALLLAEQKVKNDENIRNKFPNVGPGKKTILITGHRRESFGKPFQEMCDAIKELSLKYYDWSFIYPVHLNPNVRDQVFSSLKDLKNVSLVDPVGYPEMVWLLRNIQIVLTDSGGIQEEAPAFGKPVLVMREVTERTEGIDAGTAKLVGTGKKNIIEWVSKLIDNPITYETMANAVNPYGDGTASDQIITILKKNVL